MGRELLILSILILQYCTASELPGAGIQFPPKLVEVEGEPLGHLKPYGHQSAPEKHVKEYDEPLTAEEFWKNHVKDHIPLVYRKGIKGSPALKLWDDDYLSKEFGDLDVLVELKKENRTSSSGRMRLKDFLTLYKKEEIYVVSMLPSEMMRDIKAVPSVLCGTFKNFTHESNLWISNGGTRSVIHYDADHNLHCMIAGRKDFMMVENKYSEDLYFGPKPKGVGSGYSSLDPDVVDMNLHPNHAKVPWTYATLYPGDCIFIPSVYIHQVRSYGRSVAVTTLFTADLNENFSSADCTPDIMTTYRNMTSIDFRWTYKKGDPTIDMGFMNDELVRAKLFNFLSSKKPFHNQDGKLYWKHFIRFGFTFPHMRIARNYTKAREAFDSLSGDKDYIDMEMTNKFTREEVKRVVRLIESPHGIVTNGSQDILARPGERNKFDDGPVDEEEVKKVIADAKVSQRQAERYWEEIMEVEGVDQEGEEGDQEGKEGDQEGKEGDEEGKEGEEEGSNDGNEEDEGEEPDREGQEDEDPEGEGAEEEESPQDADAAGGADAKEDAKTQRDEL